MKVTHQCSSLCTSSGYRRRQCSATLMLPGSFHSSLLLFQQHYCCFCLVFWYKESPEHISHIWRRMSCITYSDVSLQCPDIPCNYYLLQLLCLWIWSNWGSDLPSLEIWAIIYPIKSLTSAWMLDGKTEFSFSVILLVGPLLGELGPDPGELLLTEDSEKQMKNIQILHWKGTHDLD